MSELKPCPFCGGLAYIEPRNRSATKVWWVRCYDCGIETDVYDSEKEAIESWNRRVQDD